MRKSFLIIALSTAFLFTACKDKDDGGGQGINPEATPPVSSAASAAEPPFTAAADGFTFLNNDVTVVFGAPADAVISALGEPKDVFEAPSCAFEGIDKTYFYNDFYVETFPWEGTDYISIVHFQTDGVGTPEGLYIGMSADDMRRIYGDAYTQEQGMCTYEKNGTELAILLENDEVVQITYYFMLLE